jgi:hypothetical protein
MRSKVAGVARVVQNQDGVMDRTLTKKGLATRRRIIEGAAAEIGAHGVAEVSLDDVRAATTTSKSQGGVVTMPASGRMDHLESSLDLILTSLRR